MFRRWKEITVREFNFRADDQPEPYKVKLRDAAVDQVEHAFADIYCRELIERLPVADLQLWLWWQLEGIDHLWGHLSFRGKRCMEKWERRNRECAGWLFRGCYQWLPPGMYPEGWHRTGGWCRRNLWLLWYAENNLLQKHSSELELWAGSTATSPHRDWWSWTAWKAAPAKSVSGQKKESVLWHDESGGENVKPCAYGFPLLYWVPTDFLITTINSEII